MRCVEVIMNEDLQDRLEMGCQMCIDGDHYRFYSCPIPDEDSSLDAVDQRIQPEGLCVSLNPCPVSDANRNRDAIDILYDILSLETMPFNGGLVEQPAAFVPAWRTFRQARNICENKRMKTDD